MTNAADDSRLVRWAGGVAGALILLSAWEVAGRTGALGSSWPPLTTVLEVYGDPAARDLLARALATTVGEAALGYAIGVGLAVVAGSAGILVPRMRGLIESAAAGLNSIPWILLGPLLVLVVPRWVGPVAIAALAVFFSVFVAVSTGLSAASGVHQDLLSSLGATRLVRFRRLQLPAATPELVDGLRLAAPAALVGAIFGEWFGADSGLGLLLITSMQNFRIDLLWATALLGVAASLIAYGGFSLARWAAWRRFT
jgi:sulfonate transport system permease protein